jgi:hypothetical protein
MLVIRPDQWTLEQQQARRIERSAADQRRQLQRTNPVALQCAAQSKSNTISKMNVDTRLNEARDTRGAFIHDGLPAA